ITTQLITRRISQTLAIGLTAVCCRVTLAPAHTQRPAATKAKTQYQVSNLPSLGGTSSGGNSINDQSWVAGYSRLSDRNRHATLWRNSALTDLGTLGGPNSSVTWNVKNTAGITGRMSQTAATTKPTGENSMARAV